MLCIASAQHTTTSDENENPHSPEAHHELSRIAWKPWKKEPFRLVPVSHRFAACPFDAKDVASVPASYSVRVDPETHVASPFLEKAYAIGLDGLWTEFAPAR
jgi:hypothetical protein